MRKLLFGLFSGGLLFFTLESANAQTAVYPEGAGHFSSGAGLTPYRLQSDTGILSRNWSVTRFGSLVAGHVFMPFGGASYLSAPVGLQLNRRLNDNLFAFSRLSVAPVYISYTSPFSVTGFNKYAIGNGLNNVGMYGRAELGLMYINDQKTFSISGSLGIERSSYPLYRNSHPVSGSSYPFYR